VYKTKTLALFKYIRDSEKNKDEEEEEEEKVERQ